MKFEINKHGIDMIDHGDPWFLRNIIKSTDTLMYFLSVEGQGDHSTQPFMYDGVDGDAGVAVEKYSEIVIDGEEVTITETTLFPFDKKDWRRYDRLRNEAINKMLFVGIEGA